MFQRLGYSIDIAVNGEEVLSALETKYYDIIFMDIQMPKLNGMETTQLIREKYLQSNAPYIIAMTANIMDSYRDKCLAMGMQDFLTKPVNLNTVVEALYRFPNQQKIKPKVEV